MLLERYSQEERRVVGIGDSDNLCLLEMKEEEEEEEKSWRKLFQGLFGRHSINKPRYFFF